MEGLSRGTSQGARGREEEGTGDSGVAGAIQDSALPLASRNGIEAVATEGVGGRSGILDQFPLDSPRPRVRNQFDYELLEDLLLHGRHPAW